MPSSAARELLLSHESEKAFQAQVMRWLERGGFLAYHTFDSRRSVSGFPDIFALHVRRRIILAVELKSQHGRIRPEQKTWLAAFDELATANPRTVSGIWRPTSADSIRNFVLGLSEAPPYV